MDLLFLRHFFHGKTLLNKKAQVRYIGFAPIQARSLTVPQMESLPIFPPGKNAGETINPSVDTKVAGKGQVDGVFITTTGMGEIQEGVQVGGELAKPGDAIIVTGDVGRHGCTILLAREDFGIDADVTSDCAPLWGAVKDVLDATHNIHVIRDATRGGVGTVLYEIAGQSNVGIRLDAAAVPVAPEVKGVCGMLGLEPLYLACEGRMVIMTTFPGWSSVTSPIMAASLE